MYAGETGSRVVVPVGVDGFFERLLGCRVPPAQLVNGINWHAWYSDSTAMYCELGGIYPNLQPLSPSLERVNIVFRRIRIQQPPQLRHLRPPLLRNLLVHIGEHLP